MIDHRTILEQAGYPTDVLCLDFESFFSNDYSLSKLSTIEYINDSRFEFTGLGSKTESVTNFLIPDEISSYLAAIDWGSYTTLVQNARFDITILQEKFNIVPKYIIDLKDLASHYDSRMSHRLKDMAKMFGLKPKGETMQFKGLHYSDMTSEQRQALTEYTINDVELETELFKILLPYLTNPKTELALAQHTLSLWLHKRFAVDLDAAAQLKMKMRTKMAKTIKDSGHTIKELRSQKFAGYLNEVLPNNEKVPMKQGKRGNIPALAKNDEACQQLLVHPKKEVRDLVSARLATKSWPTHIKRVESIIAQTRANGGLLRVPLNYYGGHTGRWSGGGGYNLQNFGGTGRSGQENDPLIQEVRTLIKALDGYVLGTVDSAQIEARVLAWLSGQQDMIDAFANGEDIYSELATELFGCLIRKERKTDPPFVYKFFKTRRGFGKDSILGCGYEMGWKTFYKNCIENPSLKPFFDSGEFDVKFVKKVIKTYRTKYSKIPEYWTAVERAFRQCLRFPYLQPEVGCCKFWCRGTTVHIQLPSSRVLYYHNCRIDKTNSIRSGKTYLYGGALTENIDQAISRDLLGYWILECEEAGVPITLHIHDDTRTMLPKDGADEMFEKQKAIMRTVPDWAGGLPVDIDPVMGESL